MVSKRGQVKINVEVFIRGLNKRCFPAVKASAKVSLKSSNTIFIVIMNFHKVLNLYYLKKQETLMFLLCINGYDFKGVKNTGTTAPRKYTCTYSIKGSSAGLRDAKVLIKVLELFTDVIKHLAVADTA